MPISQHIEKLKQYEQEFENFGQTLLDESPSSPIMLEFSTDFDAITQALKEFREYMESQVNQAGIENSMRVDLISQIQQHEVFSQVDSELQNKLAEFLIQTKNPLWDKQGLIEFLTDKFLVNTPQEIISDLPRNFISEIGRSVQRGDEDIDKTLYTLGVEALQKLLQDPEQKKIVLTKHFTNVVERLPILAMEYIFKPVLEKDEEDAR